LEGEGEFTGRMLRDYSYLLNAFGIAMGLPWSKAFLGSSNMTAGVFNGACSGAYKGSISQNPSSERPHRDTMPTKEIAEDSLQATLNFATRIQEEEFSPPK